MGLPAGDCAGGGDLAYSPKIPLDPEPSSSSVHIVGRYALYDAIAAGGMATVHYGRLLGPVGFSRTVAIKRLHAQFARDPEFVSMFLDEARLAARIRHPNVVPTLDVVATDGELFLVMEYVAGESLARLVRTAAGMGQLVPPRIVIAIMCGVLRGLHAAHEATNERGEPLGIVHRDVSPQNVLVGIDGQARVLDFGVAKAAGRLQTTRDGKLKGKLAYMSPEQLRGKSVDRRTDVFAASAVLWESLTGRRLFRGDNEGAIITQILEGNVVPPSTVLVPGEADDATLAAIRAVDAITLKGLATGLDVRWENARAMAVALEKAAPPAGVSEVSEWVEHFAKEVLASRAQQVADIESNSAVGPGSIRAIQEAARESTSDVASRRSRVTPTPAPAAQPGDMRSVAVDLSTISVESLALRNRPESRKRVATLSAVVAVVATLGSLVVFLALRNSISATSAPSPSVGASAVALPASPVAPVASAAPAPAVASATAPPAPSSGPDAPQAEPAAAAAATPKPLPSKPHGGTLPFQHAAPPAATGAAPAHAPSCNPPYTYDAQGLKHFKTECF